jgi:hypothetical protein
MDSLAKKIMEMKNANGGTVWDRKDGNIYAPIGFSTIDVLSVLGDIGIKYSENSTIKDAVGKMMSFYDEKKGMFQYIQKGSKLPCITAKIINTLDKLEYRNSILENSFRYFMETQCDDGGWRCATVKIGKSDSTDASNPGTTLYVLDAYKNRKSLKEEKEKLDKAVLFLLQHWDTKKPLGPCEFGIGTQFMKTEYPFIRYNLFYYLYVLSFYEKAKKDKRFKEALKELKAKEIENGINIEHPNKNWISLLFNGSNQCDLANKKYKQLIENIQ